MGNIQLLDTVALIDDLPAHGLLRGHVGTIVEVLAPDILEVEFSDDEGRTCALVELPADRLMVLRHQPVETA